MSGKCGCAALREVLPATYGYVVLVAAGGHVLNLYLSKKVVDARKQYNVKVRYVRRCAREMTHSASRNE